MPVNGQGVKFNYYTRAKFNALSSKDNNVIYYVEETDGKIKQYIGNTLVVSDFTESDPTVPAHVKSITSTNVSNWNSAYSWGNHASAGYITSSDESLELVRSSATMTTAGSGTTVSSIGLDTGKSVSSGDYLFIEVNDSSSKSHTPKIIGVMVGRTISSSNITLGNQAGWLGSTALDATSHTFRSYTFTVGATAGGSVLGFNNKFKLTGEFSGSTISWTSSEYTLYIGRIWRLKK